MAVNSAISALHIACLVLGVGNGDCVWTTPFTFLVSGALYCGATVGLVDIDLRTYNPSFDRLAEKLALVEKTGNLSKVLIPVHLWGQPCDRVGFRVLSLHYGFKIIEDASHAIGGKYKDEPIANGRDSDIAVFSFHPDKLITTGEGGMALTNNENLAKRMQMLRTHGITRDAVDMTHTPVGPWYYQQIDLGLNYRMTELQAALGLSQIQRMDEFVAILHAIASHYDSLLEELTIVTPWHHPDSYSGLHLYVIRPKLNEIRKTHREVLGALLEVGIGVNLHYIPVYRQPYYERLGFSTGHCPVEEQLYAEVISLPMYIGLTEEQQDQVVHGLDKATQG